MLISYRQNTWLSGFVNANFASLGKKTNPPFSPQTKIKIFISHFHQPAFQLYRCNLKSMEEVMKNYLLFQRF